MKRMWKKILAGGLICSLLLSSSALAAHPKGYWPYLTAFQQAQQSGDKNAMISTGEALLNYYKGLPLDTDVAGIRYNVNYNNYAIYEGMGKMEKAKEALQGVIEAGTYLNFTDAVIMAKERLEKIDAMAEVYTVSNTGAPYYGAKNEPKSGTWIGRCYTENGESAAKNEAIVSFYVELGSSYPSAKDFDWKIQHFLDGNHAILINLNFPQEGNTVSQVNSGSLDGKINETLSYLSTLTCPVFLRIGGEMNVWTTKTTPDAFKTAYNKIASMARSTAPNVALIFSPSYASPWGEDMGVYFPDPSLVDWVGASLYMNKYQYAGNPTSAGDANDMYFGLNQYADAVKSMEHVVKLADQYKKPVIVTEQGSGYALPSGGEDLSAFAVNRITESYGTLNMVYPQIKIMLYFDQNMGSYSYQLSGNSKVQAAYQQATGANPTLMTSINQTAPTFRKLNGATGLTGVIPLRSYCDVINQAVTVTYTLDGVQKASVGASPFAWNLDSTALSAGNHTLQVQMKASNGYTVNKTYQLVKGADGTVSFTQQ